MFDFIKDLFLSFKNLFWNNNPIVNSNTIQESKPIVNSIVNWSLSSAIKPSVVSAQIKTDITPFNPEFIIADQEFLNCDSMTEQQIQDFIVSKNSFLKDYDVNGKLASYWIYKNCKDLGLNPHVLMTNIQKEQGSFTKQTIPTNKTKLDYFCGVGAYSNPIRFDEKWRGIDKQIQGSVIVNIKRFNKAKNFSYPYTYKTDKPEFRILSIQNAATKSCYDYTPYVGDESLIVDGIKYDAPFGNYLFWKIYTKWFK